MNKAAEMQTVVEMTRSIPCAPAILPKLLKLTEGSAADIGELETLITMDTGLATSVLRTANSAYFGNASRCDNIADAVLRLASPDAGLCIRCGAMDGNLETSVATPCV